MKTKSAVVLSINMREARLRRDIRAHFRRLGFTKSADGELVPPNLDKAGYRDLHGAQRDEVQSSEADFLKTRAVPLFRHFANGEELDVHRMTVQLIPVAGGTWQSDLFRLATLLWSIPVSQGFGRRLRFLVWDGFANKLVGLLALGDPVFNLKARDNHIGWSGKDRQTRLVHVLDGYVLGAVPPYSLLLGGKLVACLMRTRDVVDVFRSRYAHTEGIISGKEKNAHLVAVTTTSALGRSSVYNRLKLGSQPYLSSIGYTTGFGHFHFPQSLFDDMRSYLRRRRDPYSADHDYGSGPNWKLRAIRRTLELLDLDPGLVKHGLTREVFLCAVADNALDVLTGKRKRPKYDSLLSVEEVAQLALKRWMQPRALNDERYRAHKREHLVERISRGEEQEKRNLARIGRG
jgi:hypothetical protein